MINLELVWPVAASMVAGGLIGVERTYHGHPAGFRTHILVCLTSCLLMLAAMQQSTWAFTALAGQTVVIDPTRMSHGLLTGIGFLCAGVIFREGFSVHGLTTAASLWITASIGLLFGAGLFVLGAVGAILTLAILVLLRLISRGVRQKTVVDAEVVWRRADPGAEAGIESVIAALDGQRRADRFELIDGGACLRRTFRLRLDGEAELKTLAARLGAVEGVTGFRLDPRDD